MIPRYVSHCIVAAIIIFSCLSTFSCKRPVEDSTVTKQQAIDTIKKYGGFVIFDNNGDVNRVSLVYHEDESGNRIECKGTSDDILRFLPALSETKELLIHGSQATDAAMLHVAKLTNLNLLCMWDAEVTDAGIAHFSSLTNLRFIHINNSRITDKSLLYLSRLKQLEKMSLQENNFTDEGLAYLVEMPNLKSLWIGLGSGNITDDGVYSLSHLTSLEELDLQKTAISDKALDKLISLKNLQNLCLHGTNVSVEAIDQLKKAIPDLKVTIRKAP